ncbi:family 78 glycoside hydrolase catalytic domain [Niabella aquatica]
MNKMIASFSLLLLCTAACAQTSVKNLLTENLVNPIGLDVVQPSFSWQLAGPGRNIVQSAYEIKVSEENKTAWSSGKIMSDSSVHVTYKGSPLRFNTKYKWQVRVWDQAGKMSGWSPVASFQTGLLDSTNWQAQWIEATFAPSDNESPCPLFRRPFSLSKKIARATAYITAHGLYEAYINGTRIGDAWLTPGWTKYSKRLQYQAYDVTPLLKSGANVVAAMVGNGWYRSVLGWQNNGNIYGKTLGLLLQVNITYSDGSSEVVTTDNYWKSSSGEIMYSQVYDGEIIDARKQKQGWKEAGYDDGDWNSVKVVTHPKDILIATVNEPVKQHETFRPVKLITTPAGEKVIDFGQNLVGWVQVKMKGNAGDTLTISHAEVLDKEGNFYIENLRAAKAQAKYILKGGGTETFHPYFTWMGFRYIKIEGYRGEIDPADFEAVALYSAMEPTGSFTTSNSLINQLQHNIQWGQKGNFLDVPTDCPQRDERLGWTGDAQVFARTAAFNMNVHNFFAKWLRDIEAEQDNGVVPYVVPNVLGKAGNSAGWADAATIVPWQMYLAYGDKRLLATQYGSMKAFIESIRRASKNDLWNTGWHFGDWLFYRPFDDNDGRSAVTDKNLIAQCFYAHAAQLLINTAKILGKTADMEEYTALLKRIKDAFNTEYVTQSGRLVSGTQTAYVLALQFDMLPEAQRQPTAEKLVENIKSYGNHLTTGFLGTPYLCHVLTRFGADSVAYKLLLQDSYPSWLYPVKMGATTIWERWDGMKPDSTFQTPGMNSFNHYAYGAIGDWMYRKMAGIDTYEDGAGYKHILVMPHIGGGFKDASATLKTYYGLLGNSWKVNNDKLVMATEIPPNTRATVYIPAEDVQNIKESGKALSEIKAIKITGKEQGYVIIETGSGKYNFEVVK